MGTRYGTSINLATWEYETDDGAILTQAIEVRLSTSPGTFFKDPLYGLNLQGALGESYNATTGARLGARIATEVGEDERFESAVATVDKAGAFKIFVTPSDGPEFQFTGRVDDIRAALAQQEAEDGA